MQSPNNSYTDIPRGYSMHFLRFLQSSWIEIVLDIILSASVFFILNTSKVNAHLSVFIVLCILITGFIRLLIRYSSDKRFWIDVDNLLQAGIDVSDVNSLVHEPMSYQGRITHSAIDALISQYARSKQSTQSQIADQKEFIETWIHEVKTPLAASYLIADHYPGSDAIELKRQLARIEAYTEQALFHSRMQSLDRDYLIKPVLVSHMVNEAIKSRSLFLIENDIHIKLDNLNHEVLCDEKWMIFIIGQIIDNAIKYRDTTKAVSTLEFKLSEIHDDVEDKNVLSIIDNGIGIPSSEMKRIFDKGFTGGNGRRIAKEKATGMGLYLVDNLARKMGIGIDLSSTEGEYTCVEIIFNRLSDD